MTIFTRISLLVAFLLPLSLLSCRNGDGSNITGKPGDLPDEVVSLSVENPRQALALIDSAESGQLMTPFECEYLRCVTYHNGLSQYRMAILHGTKAYEMPEARDNADNFLALVEMLADEYLSMGDHSESTRLCAEGLELAKDSLLIKREANLHVTMGLNLLDMNQDDEAFRHFSEAEKASRQLAAGSDGYEDSDNFLYTLGVLANALSDKGKTDRAIELFRMTISIPGHETSN